MRRPLAAAVALVTAFLLVGCSLVPAPDVTSSPDVRGVPAALRDFYGQRIVWKACDGGFRCATAEAPLDWAEPAGKRIELALTVHPAAGKRIGTLFTNPGGPGASGVEFLQRSLSLFGRSLQQQYDIVSWDPRGVGASTAVECYGTRALDRFLFSDPDLPEGSPALRQEVEASAKAFADACAERSGPLIAHVGTADTVRDLDMLRAAVGSPKLDYLGFSYGTTIGAQYANRYPTTVGRMVLDGATDPAISTFQESLANAQAFGNALRTYLADCLRQQDCPFRGQTVTQATGTITDLLLSLRASPIRTTSGRVVNSSVLRTAIDAALYDRSSWQYLTQAFTELRNGDGTTALALADNYVERGPNGYTGNLFEAIYAVNCLDAPVATDPAVLARQGDAIDAVDPLSGANNTEDLGNPVCANWTVPPQSKPAPVQAVGSPPIVVLGSTGDPATPYRWAQALAEQLPKGVLLTRVGQGHTAYGRGVACIDDRVDAYLTRGAVPAAVRCA
ncbi:alpha/beta hydrolase [Amnibacterium endophyticum]|uniref:Alpha/beta hydrolase n=1 Tax=Amnibacterium endophyticum TaxID=2109337 RepID=A0ABW4LCR1_9MICO